MLLRLNYYNVLTSPCQHTTLLMLNHYFIKLCFASKVNKTILTSSIDTMNSPRLLPPTKQWIFLRNVSLYIPKRFGKYFAMALINNPLSETFTEDDTKTAKEMIHNINNCHAITHHFAKKAEYLLINIIITVCSDKLILPAIISIMPNP